MKLPAIREAAFEQQVLDLAATLGFMRAHFRPAMRADGTWRTPVAGDAKGFPDLVLVGRGKVVFAELKSETGKLRPEQAVWLDALRAAGHAHVYVWRPSDFDTIVQILANRPPTPRREPPCATVTH